MILDGPTRASAIKPEQVRDQLKRILAHPIFKASRRCQTLLQYLVEYALSGEKGHPKERTLGVEVFGRDPDYDTNDDPVVRSTATDIRRRIAQYYHEPVHEKELRIDLPSGSYLTEFHLSDQQGAEAQAEKEVAQAPAIAPEPPARKRFQFYLALIAAIILILCALAMLRLRTPEPLDRFWSPVLKQSNNVNICILATESGIQSKTNSNPIASPLGIPFESVTDSTALAQIAQFLGTKRVRFNVRLSSLIANQSNGSLSPSLSELRDSPVIFVGNSDWAMRLLSPLRFHLQTDQSADLLWIEDRQNPSAKSWSGKIDLPYEDYSQDYAIISRVFDATTGQTVVAITGLGLHATAAAAEFVTSSSLMSQVAAGNSPDWQKKNLQIVISTKIAGESWGTPQLLAKYFW